MNRDRLSNRHRVQGVNLDFRSTDSRTKRFMLKKQLLDGLYDKDGTVQEKSMTRRVIVILEKCPLESAKIGDKMVLLNGDLHFNFLSKFGKDHKMYRPDIVHQCLLTLLDSPLNKSGHLYVFIHTTKNVLIRINPHVRIPRTFNRFCGLMIQLLFKFSIESADGKSTLMKVVKNPVTDHIPVNCKKIVKLTPHAKVTQPIQHYIFSLIDQQKKEQNKESVSDKDTQKEKNGSNEDDSDSEEEEEESFDSSVAFVVGGFADDKLDVTYTNDELCVSKYELSASVACSKICNAFENHWEIL